MFVPGEVAARDQCAFPPSQKIPAHTNLKSRIGGIRPSDSFALRHESRPSRLRILPSACRLQTPQTSRPESPPAYRRIAFCKRVTISGSATSVSGIVIRMSCRCSASVNPGSTRSHSVERTNHQAPRRPAAPAPSPLARPPEYCARDGVLGSRSAFRPALRETTRRPRPVHISAPESGRTSRPENTERTQRERPAFANPPKSPASAADSPGRSPSKTHTRIRQPRPRAPAHQPQHHTLDQQPRTIRPHPAPSAARTAISCCRAPPAPKANSSRSRKRSASPARSCPSPPTTRRSRCRSLPASADEARRNLPAAHNSADSLPGPFVTRTPSRSAACASCPRSPARSSLLASAAQFPDNPNPARISFAAIERQRREHVEILIDDSESRAASPHDFPRARIHRSCSGPSPCGRRQISAASIRSSTSRAPARSVS